MNLWFIVVLSLLAVGYAMGQEKGAVKVKDREIRGRQEGDHFQSLVFICRENPRL